MSEKRDALDWVAFCYVADELSDAERAEFESQLASDQAAREAVARAVELTQATRVAYTVLSTPVFRTQHPWLQRATWMAAGAALCLAFLVLSSLRDSAEKSRSSDIYSPALLSAWSEAREPVQQQDGLPESPADNEFMETTVESPSWMLAAVARASETETEE